MKEEEEATWSAAVEQFNTRKERRRGEETETKIRLIDWVCVCGGYWVLDSPEHTLSEWAHPPEGIRREKKWQAENTHSSLLPPPPSKKETNFFPNNKLCRA